MGQCEIGTENCRCQNAQTARQTITSIVQVKGIATGDYVGYGLSYRASRAMRVGVLPMGYYDGYSRALSNSSRVLVRGQFAPVVGRVAMNMTMIPATCPRGEIIVKAWAAE